jgi:catechol 2,3-dioxygenase-like lactoylglutathione lyase family enzyme
MLSDSSVTTMLPVKDIDRARAFYEGCLGLRPGGFRPDGKFVYALGGSTLALFPKPEGTKADHTAISFRVADIAASIEELKRAGVVFEDYDFPGLKTVNHVCVLGAEKAAWFKDTEGNYLCIHEDIPES